MTLFLKNSVVDDIFTKLDDYLKLNDKLTIHSFNITDLNDHNQRGEVGVSFNLLISNEAEYLYANFLNQFYHKEVKPFLIKNKQVFDMLPEVFSRFYLVNNDTTSWMCGKTVHNTQLSHWVSNHYPEGNNFLNLVWTQHEYGHLSHFRTSLKDLHNRNISIRHLNFDLNYFLCYFKPIVQELNFKIKF